MEGPEVANNNKEWKLSSAVFCCRWYWLPPAASYLRQSLYLPHRLRKNLERGKGGSTSAAAVAGGMSMPTTTERAWFSFLFLFVLLLRLWHFRNTAYYACMPAFHLRIKLNHFWTRSHTSYFRSVFFDIFSWSASCKCYAKNVAKKP